jgi:hypothetical protein
MTFPGTLPGLLLRLFTNHKPEVLADKVASRSRLRVWDRVSHRMHELAGAEARGYIRARGGAVIEQETDRLIAEEGAKAVRHRDEILHAAGESVIRLVLEQANLSWRSALPKRRAA